MTDTESIPTERFLYYDLAINTTIHLLAAGQEIVVDCAIGYAMLLQWNRMHHQIVSACQFSDAELPLALALLNAWPSFVEQEKLLQILMQRPIEDITTLLDTASNETLAPLHTLMESCRTKVQALRIDLQDVNGQGYKLGRLPKASTSEEEAQP